MEVESDKQEDLKAMLSATTIIIAVGFFIFSYAWRNIKMANLNYEIRKLSSKRKDLYYSVEKIRLQISGKATAAKIDEMIRGELSHLPFQPASKTTIIKLPKIVN